MCWCFLVFVAVCWCSVQELEDFMTKADHLRVSEAMLLAEQSQMAQDRLVPARKIDSG
jgi:hypothetical protein